MGHALGFFHTSSTDDLMFNTVRVCDGAVSSRERLHAAIAYSRPIGNVDPDSDPQTTVNLQSLPDMARGALIADFIACVAMLDPILGGIDR